MIVYENKSFKLTEKGALRARRIIRLHRLWEVYLFSVLGVNASEVHQCAEEMEHIITKELEEQLTLKLGDPKKDPHNQDIPKKRGGLEWLLVACQYIGGNRFSPFCIPSSPGSSLCS